ncbi:hypothetical protein ABZT03_41930 [Streptomyces sp. NPDC005574]|uniref:hypothetical protein n=1 Tax=Streptomyces sp. NPDC005574 TaxID=3156891 RepID=UPI0033A18A0F
MRASPAIRGLRAAVFAAWCVLLAAGGHVLATGMVPPVWAQAAAFLPLCAVGYLSGGRERSLAAIGAGTLTAQGALHLAFDAVRPRTATGGQGMGAVDETRGGRGTCAMPSMSNTRGMQHMQGMQGMRMSPPHTAHPHMVHGHMASSNMVHPHMVAAHALTSHATVAHVMAAVGLTWWLRCGEAALWSLLRRAVTFVPGLAAWWQVNSGTRCVPAVPGPVRPAAGGPASLRQVLLRHAVHRRGPPTAISFAI